MPMCDALKQAKRRKWYFRYKLRNPSHLAQIGHRWKPGTNNDGSYTGHCIICGEPRFIPNLKPKG